MKKLFIFLLALIAFLLKSSPILADTNFQTDINVEYKILESGKTTVTNTISIKNLTSDYFPKKYVLNLKGVNPENIRAYEIGRLLKTSIEQIDSQTKLTVNFDNLSVGKGTTKTFIVSFDDSTLTQKTGEIWEVVLPKVTDPENYTTYKTSLSVPTVLGEEAYVSPEPSNITSAGERIIYKFDDYKNLSSGVTAGFGIFQVFAFNLNYYLEGTNQIALPPDTSTQKMFYESINPVPLNVDRDEDGNWIATYEIAEGEKKHIEVSGYVQIFSDPSNLLGGSPMPSAHDIAPTTYWQSDNPKIIEIASSLEGPQEIYQYVVSNLNYNIDRASDTYLRYGAVKALENPSDALCMEFTDLFIALSRAKGIPAREINGYAYSQNSALEPLSLVSDVLHSWPEYWDNNRKLWIPVDPTWGNTTGGVDFFNKFDLRHFAFVIHSKNPITPYSVGVYKNSTDPQKDINISFSHLPQRKPLNVKIVASSSHIVPFFVTKLNLNVTNSGNTALYNFPINSKIGSQNKRENIPSFLPFSNKNIAVTVNHGLFGISSYDYVTLQAGELVQNISTNKENIILGQLGILLTTVFLIVFWFHFRAHRNLYYSSIQKILTACSENELNADMSSSLKWKPRFLVRGGCHKYLSKALDYLKKHVHRSDSPKNF